MKKLHYIDMKHIDLIRKQWEEEAVKYGDLSDYADAFFIHAKSLQEKADGEYYGVLNSGDGCLMLSHIKEVILPTEHHKTLRCSQYITCPGLQFERNALSVKNRLITAYTALVKEVFLMAVKRQIYKIKIHSPPEIHPHFWNGVLVLFRTEDIVTSDNVEHEIELQGTWAVITTRQQHE